jgi:hypothetical protein
VKNYSPNYLASVGYYSTTDNFILQFLSSLKSFRAGTIDYYRFSSPITLFKCSNLLNRFNLTSDDSSLKSAKNIGKICSFVKALSIIGHNDNTFSANAYLTYVN